MNKNDKIDEIIARRALDSIMDEMYCLLMDESIPISDLFAQVQKIKERANKLRKI